MTPSSPGFPTRASLFRCRAAGEGLAVRWNDLDKSISSSSSSILLSPAVDDGGSKAVLESWGKPGEAGSLSDTKSALPPSSTELVAGTAGADIVVDTGPSDSAYVGLGGTLVLTGTAGGASVAFSLCSEKDVKDSMLVEWRLTPPKRG